MQAKKTNASSRNLCVGQAGEHLVIANLLQKGYRVLRAPEAAPYDLVLDVNDTFYRLDVKTSSRPRSRSNCQAVYGFNTHGTRSVHGKQMMRKKSPDATDFYALVALDVGKIAYISREHILKSDGEIMLKICGLLYPSRSRNKNSATIVFDDYAEFPIKLEGYDDDLL